MKNAFYDASKEGASEFAGRVCRESWENSPFVNVGSSGEHFRAGRSYTFKDIPFLTEEQKAFLERNPGMYLPN